MADSRGLLQFLKFTKTGWMRAIMRDKTVVHGAPDYTGYGVDVSGEPRAVAVWVDKSPGNTRPALQVMVKRLKAPEGGKIRDCELEYRGDVLVGLTATEWIVGHHGPRNCPTCGTDLWRELKKESAHEQSVGVVLGGASVEPPIEGSGI